MLLIDEKAALAAVPSLLPGDAAVRSEGFNAIREVLAACGETSAEDDKRLSEIGRLFGIAEDKPTIALPQHRRGASAKAS